MGRTALLAIAVAAGLVGASPASAIGILCQVGTKPCHDRCIPRHATCLRCTAGTWYCNGHCIPKRQVCPIR